MAGVIIRAGRPFDSSWVPVTQATDLTSLSRVLADGRVVDTQPEQQERRILFLIALIVSAGWLAPINGEICEQAKQAAYKNCTTHHVFLVLSEKSPWTSMRFIKRICAPMVALHAMKASEKMSLSGFMCPPSVFQSILHPMDLRASAGAAQLHCCPPPPVKYTACEARRMGSPHDKLPSVFMRRLNSLMSIE